MGKEIKGKVKNIGLPKGSSRDNFFAVFGPGILFAATSVGISHVVQSTRAGSMFGLGIIGIIIFINIIKYPLFQFGAQYSLVTGTSLIQGYKNLSKWALIIHALFVIMLMFITVASLSLVTSSVLIFLFSLEISLTMTSFFLLVFCMALVSVGGFSFLEKLVSFLVVLFTVITILVTSVVLYKYEVFYSFTILPTDMTLEKLFFIVALLGFMPVGLEAGIWTSLWTLEKAKSTPTIKALKNFHLDFNIGYICTTILAICFVIMGTAVMYNADMEFSRNGPKFIEQLIGIYSDILGNWSVPIVGACICSALFSTLIILVDGYPRSLMVTFARLTTDESPWEERPKEQYKIHKIIMIAGAGGSMFLIYQFSQSFSTFIDFVTTSAFVMTPVVAILNHFVMNSDAVPVQHRPAGYMKFMSIFGIIILTFLAFTFGYLKIFY